jgi:hypothetical protein
MKEHVLAVMVGLALLGGEGGGVAAHHALGTEAQIAWKARLQRVDDALARNDLAGAEGFWREAYTAALKSRHWEGMVAVGDAYRRIGARAGFRAIADAKARETYLAALFRARSQDSVEGVLRAAQGFADLGDHAIVEQCLRVAQNVAAQSKDPRAGARVRMFAERWAARAREADHLGLTP